MIQVVYVQSLKNVLQHSHIYKVTQSSLQICFRKMLKLNAYVGTLTFVDIVPSWFLSNISKAALKAASSSGRNLSAILNYVY